MKWIYGMNDVRNKTSIQAYLFKVDQFNTIKYRKHPYRTYQLWILYARNNYVLNKLIKTLTVSSRFSETFPFS